MVRVETRPLGPGEELQLVEEAAAGLSRGALGCLLVVGLVAMPGLGWLMADNLADWLRLPHGPSVRAGVVAGFLAGATYVAFPFLLVSRGGRRLLRDERRLTLAAGPVERWTFEPVRAWNVECAQSRALLFSLSDHRLVLLAGRALEGLPLDRYPAHLEMEVLPQLDRLLRLEASGEHRPTETVRFTLEELGNDYPLKKRRFAEISADGLDDGARTKLGLPARAREARVRGKGPLPLDRNVRANDEQDWLPRLATGTARVAARILTWMVPAFVVVTLVAARPLGLRLPRDGAASSVLLVLLVLWCLGALLGELVRQRSALRVLLRGHGRLVHLSGRVRAPRTFPAPLTARPAVLARVDLLLGPHGLIQAVDFELERVDGSLLRVDVREARPLREGSQHRIVRVETREAERLLGDVEAEWARKRPYQFAAETVIGDGDVVQLLGRLDAEGTIGGTPERPLLVWTGELRSASLPFLS